MTQQELINWCSQQLTQNRVLTFPEEVFPVMPEEVASEIVKKFSDKGFMKLPKKEINFMEWLKEKDPKIWKDLWEDDHEEPYIVSLSFLPLLIGQSRGYQICDLVDNDNFYFSMSHIVDKGSEFYLDSVKQRFLNKKELSNPQMLALEITLGPIDVWHFAHRHRLSIEDAKKAVDVLVDDQLIVHLTEAEHLAGFIEI